jgi:gag-polypeptide of LTR copia-type
VLYWITAEEGFDMVEHILKLCTLQEELHLMENKVLDDDFVMILIMLLPESWDQYTFMYLGSNSNKPTLNSHELITILLEGGSMGEVNQTQPLGWPCRPRILQEGAEAQT